jgi:hypothetical protein
MRAWRDDDHLNPEGESAQASEAKEDRGGR